MQKYKKIGQGVQIENWGVWEVKTRGPLRARPRQPSSLTSSQHQTRVLPSILYLALACIKSKTHNIKSVACKLVIPMI